MAADDTISRIARLLASETAEKQIAAAIVLGELKSRDPQAVNGLLALLASGVAPLQRRALLALAAIGSPKTLEPAVRLLASHDDSVRAAALEAVLACGETAPPVLRARLAAPDAAPAEKRAIEEALGRLGSKEALATIFGSLPPEDLEAARVATVPLRTAIREADPRGRARFATEAARYLAGKAAAKSAAGRVAALKVLGFLEDAGHAPLFMRYAAAKKEADGVRQEALFALRLAAGAPPEKKPDAGAAGKPKAPAAKPKAKPPAIARLAPQLVGIAESAPLPVARAALMSLVGVPLLPALTRRLVKLARHREAERAVFAIDLLGHQPDGAAGGELARLLVESDERPRVEAAARAVSSRGDAGPLLLRALQDARDASRAEVIGRALRPQLQLLDDKQRAALIRAAADRVAAEHAAAPALLAAARAADAARTAAALRALADKLRKGRKPEAALRVMRLVGHAADATPDDGYALAALELTHGLRGEALRVFGLLAARHFDVAAALRRDRGLDHEHRYQVGFHFAEQGHPLGEEILSAVAEAAGQTKIGKMARAKLKSSGF